MGGNQIDQKKAAHRQAAPAIDLPAVKRGRSRTNIPARHPVYGSQKHQTHVQEISLM
jgi:hypothetical protein